MKKPRRRALGLLGSLIGAAVLCVGTGPASALCALVAGAVGGVLGRGAVTDTDLFKS